MSKIEKKLVYLNLQDNSWQFGFSYEYAQQKHVHLSLFSLGF